jgi:Tol biopolymer transport system component
MNGIYLKKIIPLVCAIFLILPKTSISQNSEEDFGQSRIQYRYFEWKFYSTPHFDIYYYYGGQKLAKQLAENIEEDFLRITDIMGYAPYNKTKIFVFNSNLDYNQSNVGLNEAQFDISGQTNFLKTHVEVAYAGSFNAFKEELVYKISKLYVKDMLFGGGLVSEVFQSNSLFNVPEWFISGIAAYIAYGWNAEMDDYVRNFLVENNARNIDKLEGLEAELAGQSIWNFISEKYGRINISNTLNLTRIIRNEEKSITNTLGIPFKAFLNEYRYFYVNNFSNMDTEEPLKRNQISKPWKSGIDYSSKISPNGEFLAYSINNRGRYKIKLREISTGNEKTIFRGGQQRLEEFEDTFAPAMDWGDSTTLGIVSYERGVNYLFLYDPYTNKFQKRDLRRFDQVNHLDIYPNGKTAVISANINAQSDLYLISTGRPNIRRLTNDVFDDLYPAFIPDTKRIIFSSNRNSDSLSTEYNYKDIANNFNLFELDIDEPDQLKQITRDFGQNLKVVIPNNNSIFYVSDKSGIFNLYHFDLTKGTSKQISAYGTGIKDFDIRPAINYYSFVLNQNGNENLYFRDDFSGNESKFLPSTLRKQVQLSRKFSSEAPKQKKSINKPKELQDMEKSNLRQDSSLSSLQKKLNETDESTSKLNADNFDFEKQQFENENKESSLLKNLSKLRNTASMMGPFDYEPTFTTNNVTASWKIDPLVGLSMYSRYQMNDLRENNKFYGGFDLSLQDFKSGSIFGEYQYLERLVDYSIRFEREVYSTTLDNRFTDQTYSLNNFSFGGAFPFSNNSRLSIKPHIIYQQFIESSFNVLTQQNTLAKSPLQSDFLFGGKIEYVYDNSEPLGLNMRQGLRGKIAFENYTAGFGAGESFSKLYIDVRNYQKIFREITFASRFYAGGFFGQNSPYFMLGGIDNWVFRRVNEPENGAELSPEENPLALTSSESPIFNSNILFHEFVTGLRGFQLNEFSGRNVVLLSNELRFPLFRVLSNNSMSSNFARNFQLIGFYDIGTAWLGGSPWDQDNSINRQRIESDNFKAVIRNYKNPWLSSVGLGLRTTLLGYYLRLDYAYPIEDYIVQDPRLSLSIGYDF